MTIMTTMNSALNEGELAGLMRAYHAAAQRLERSHDLLRDEVCRLRGELNDKNKELARRERLAALGEMAAGVAHEIRNPLGGIGLYASLLERDLADRPEQQGMAVRIRAGVGNVERIISDILAFSGGAEPKVRPCLLGELVSRVLEPLSGRMESLGVDVTVDDRLGSVMVQVDPGQIDRAMLNLVTNALEATGRGGHVRLRLGDGQVDSNRVVMLVEDDGPGIAAGHLQRIFNPFFTTKESGTGLGLAIVHRIAEAHGGSVVAANRPEGGAVFALHLPTMDPKSDPEPKDEALETRCLARSFVGRDEFRELAINQRRTVRHGPSLRD